MRDGQGVALGRVVAVERVEVAKDQKRRPLATGGQDQSGLPVAAGPGPSVGAAHPSTRPFADRDLVPPVRLPVETGGQHDLHAPGFTRAPAGAPQVIGGRSERIGDAVHQVAPPVAVEIHGQAPEGRGHELGMTEGPGPGTHQPLGRHMTALKDLQGGEQLAPEERLTPAETGQRGQGGHQRPPTDGPAVIGFHSPDRHHHGRIDPELALDGGQRLAPLGESRPAVRHPFLVHQTGHIVPDRGTELGLRVEKPDYVHVRGQSARVSVESSMAHAVTGCLLAQLRQAAFEGGDRREQRGQDENDDER